MSTPLNDHYPRGPRVALREFRPDDLVAWQRIAGDPRVAAHTPWPALATPDAAGGWLAETARVASLRPRRSWYLAIETYGDLIGAATLDILSIPHRQGEIGVYLRPDRWGEALGTETARLLLEMAFSRMGLHRVQATADPLNVPARHVLENVHMRKEGVLIDRFLVGGQWRDRAMFAITMPEWRGAGGAAGAAVTGAAGAAGVGAAGAAGASAPSGPSTEGHHIPADEPLTGETVPAPPPAPEPEPEEAEPPVLTAQIVTKQIEVVEILPEEP